MSNTIKFLCAKGETPPQIHRQIREGYGNNALEMSVECTPTCRKQNVNDMGKEKGRPTKKSETEPSARKI